MPVIFTITQPPIGEVEIPVNNQDRVGVSGLEGIVSLGTEISGFADVTFSRTRQRDVPEDVGSFSLRRGDSKQVTINSGAQSIEGSLRYT